MNDYELLPPVDVVAPPTGSVRAVRRDVRRMFREMSDRTFQRYWSAYQALAEYGEPGDGKRAAQAATRRNGSFNVAESERQATMAVLGWLQKDDR